MEQILFDPRDPFSAGSHAVWFLLTLPGGWLLWKRSAGDPDRRGSAAVYALSLMFCSFSSTLYHATTNRVDVFESMDYIGIYLLIAGTNTVIAWNLLDGRRRRNILAVVWCAAIAGSGLHLSCLRPPQWLSTGMYLMMGWGSVFACTEVARRIPWRPMASVLIGGMLYSVGAALNLLRWPALYPGVVGPHDLFHVFVVAASAVHFWFVYRIALDDKYKDVANDQL